VSTYFRTVQDVKIKKLIYLPFLFVITHCLLSQELRLSKDSLYFPSESSSDGVTLYNIGTSSLLINGINSNTYVGYHVNIKLKDTTIYTYILPPKGPELSFSIEPGDSADLFLYGPYCPICKRSEYFHDTIVVHSNSISNLRSYIYVDGEKSTGVENSYTQLNGYILRQNYPNPFNPTTTISFELPGESCVRLRVFDMLGRELQEMLNEKRKAGMHQYQFDGGSLASGVYFFRLEAASVNNSGKKFLDVRRMLLLK
jgi:hypothetical protein